jgi:hypothetical protein
MYSAFPAQRSLKRTNSAPSASPATTGAPGFVLLQRVLEARNEIEQLFRRLKGFRRPFSCFEKLNLVSVASVHFALIIEASRQC